MMALAGVELEMLVSEPDALTTRPPPLIYVITISNINYKTSTVILRVAQTNPAPR